MGFELFFGFFKKVTEVVHGFLKDCYTGPCVRRGRKHPTTLISKIRLISLLDNSPAIRY